MISYREWKLQNVTEAVASVDAQIEKLIDATVGEIESALTDYVSRNAPERAAPAAEPEAPAGPSGFEKAGRLTGQFARGVGKGISNYMNQPVPGASGQTRKELLAKKHPGLHSLAYGAEKPSGTGLWNKFKDRLSGFFMKKEWEEFDSFIENAVSDRELQSLLVECGVSRLTLNENNGAFGQLRQIIRGALQNLGGKIKVLIQASSEAPRPGEPAPAEEFPSRDEPPHIMPPGGILSGASAKKKKTIADLGVPNITKDAAEDIKERGKGKKHFLNPKTGESTPMKVPFSDKPAPFGDKPAPFGDKPAPFGDKPAPDFRKKEAPKTPKKRTPRKTSSKSKRGKKKS